MRRTWKVVAVVAALSLVACTTSSSRRVAYVIPQQPTPDNPATRCAEGCATQRTGVTSDDRYASCLAGCPGAQVLPYFECTDEIRVRTLVCFNHTQTKTHVSPARVLGGLFLAFLGVLVLGALFASSYPAPDGS